MRTEMPDDLLSRIQELVQGQREEMIGFLSEIISISAIGPGSGGEGEMKKAKAIEDRLVKWGFTDIRRLDAVDDRVPDGIRPNLQINVKGRDPGKRYVIIVHMDVVPTGDRSLWDSDPFKLVRVNEKLIGRGVEDNGQAIVASIFALKTLKDLGLRPSHDVSLFLVSDEEETNEKGIGHLLKEGSFRKDDLILVPDHGDPDGRMIELTEKALLWIKVTVRGKQCHASMPNLGNNAFRASMLFGTKVDRILHERFPEKDIRFDHPFSSFEPTKKEPGVQGINILPGEDSFYFDCRLLPQHSMDDVLGIFGCVAREVEKETSTRIEIETVLSESTIHPTPPNAEIVQLLSKAIKTVTGKDPTTGGIGGGTCAAILRNAGFAVAVWETILNQAHAPNEYITIDNLINDSLILSLLFIGEYI
jgi:succinyl-diaminopimelate desuccinylase